MKAAITDGKGHVEVREHIPMPRPGPYSHCLPFEQLAERFRLIQKKEAFKVVFEF